MGTCRSSRQASWEEVAAVNESPLLTLGNLVLRWHSDLGIPRNGALLFSRPCRPEVNVSMQLLGRTATFPNLSSNDTPMQENRGSSPRIFAQSPDVSIK